MNYVFGLELICMFQHLSAPCTLRLRRVHNHRSYYVGRGVSLKHRTFGLLWADLEVFLGRAV